MLAMPIFVAPRAGAWVETELGKAGLNLQSVAPRAGAWVETSANKAAKPVIWSHPVRVRGLKQKKTKEVTS